MKYVCVYAHNTHVCGCVYICVCTCVRVCTYVCLSVCACVCRRKKVFNSGGAKWLTRNIFYGKKLNHVRMLIMRVTSAP